MELSGPMKDTKILGYIPGPGRYDSNKSMLDNRASTMRVKLPDTTYKHLLKASFILCRIQVQEHMNLSKWERICIMQLPSTEIIQILRLIQDLVFLR